MPAERTQAGIDVAAQTGVVRITVLASNKRAVLRVTPTYARELANELITAAWRAEGQQRDPRNPLDMLRDIIEGRRDGSR